MSTLFDAVFAKDPDLRGEVLERNASEIQPGVSGMPECARASMPARLAEPRVRDAADGTESAFADPFLEAIVLFDGRPSLLVRNGTFERPPLRIWQERLAAAQSRIEHAIASVGRIEIANHPFLRTRERAG